MSLKNKALTLGFIVATAAMVGIEPVKAQDDAVEQEGWFNRVEYFVGGDEAIEQIREGLLTDLAQAEQRIDAAISVIDDAEISAALIEAAERGVEVRIVAHALYEGTPGFAALEAHEKTPVVFGDGELKYLPDPTLSPLLEFCQAQAHNDAQNPWTNAGDHVTCTRSQGFPNTDNMIQRAADFNTMSHTFFLIDSTSVWNITAPLTEDQKVWLAFRAMSEDLSRSYEREFRQMWGGVFSTTLSVYNGPLKSMTQTEPMRLTNRGHLRVRFNPQERLIKKIIDETYRARASIFIMSENIQNRDLINALRYKEENGFDVRILYGQGQGSTGLQAMQEAGLTIEQAPASMGKLPTFIVMDSERDRLGVRRPRLVQILSHELWRAEPFEVLARLPDDYVRVYPSDTFADGALWEIVESWNIANPEADPFVEAWEAMWNEAVGR